MLRDYLGFKGSLWHEYIGILKNFQRVLPLGGHRTDGGLAALALVDATYRAEQLIRSVPLYLEEGTP